MLAASAQASDVAVADAVLENVMAEAMDAGTVFPPLSSTCKDKICADAHVAPPVGNSMDKVVRFGKCSATRQTFGARSCISPIYAALSVCVAPVDRSATGRIVAERFCAQDVESLLVCVLVTVEASSPCVLGV